MRAFYIRDPELLFFNNNKAIDPCHGLSVYGPYGVSRFKSIKIALIGSSESIFNVENLFIKMKNKIFHSKSLRWPFPGLGSKLLRIDFQIINKQIFKTTEMKIFEDLTPTKRIDRIKYAISLIDSKFNIISDIEPKPDVVVISIPKEILKSCRDDRFRHKNTIFLTKRQFDVRLKNYKEGYNFHNIIKIIGMEKQIPTQLIYPYTLIPNPKEEGRQDLSMIAWNLTVALLYKANEIPWKFFEFPEKTCFIGISFHKEFDDNDDLIMRSAIAQIFLSNGKDIVLKGEQFEWDDNYSKNPHMTKAYARRLIEFVLYKYKKHWDHLPDRVVIHKSSEYWEEEASGLEEGLRNVNKIDLISISNTYFRFFRLGQETVVRGTLLEFLGKYLLFSVGYLPCLDIYPGSRIPSPVEIKFYRTDDDKIKICKEILALSRLNWNNVDYSTKFPVTITFSKNVGNILSEYRAKSLHNPPDKYRYFM
ncbi:MAG: hypothetical protein ACFE8A_12395 [Candidatus Hodarchaeota archaeon]